MLFGFRGCGPNTRCACNNRESTLPDQGAATLFSLDNARTDVMGSKQVDVFTWSENRWTLSKIDQKMDVIKGKNRVRNAGHYSRRNFCVNSSTFSEKRDVIKQKCVHFLKKRSKVRTLLDAKNRGT